MGFKGECEDCGDKKERNTQEEVVFDMLYDICLYGTSGTTMWHGTNGLLLMVCRDVARKSLYAYGNVLTIVNDAADIANEGSGRETELKARAVAHFMYQCARHGLWSCDRKGFVDFCKIRSKHFTVALNSALADISDDMGVYADKLLIQHVDRMKNMLHKCKFDQIVTKVGDRDVPRSDITVESVIDAIMQDGASTRMLTDAMFAHSIGAIPHADMMEVAQNAIVTTTIRLISPPTE